MKRHFNVPMMEAHSQNRTTRVSFTTKAGSLPVHSALTISRHWAGELVNFLFHLV